MYSLSYTIYTIHIYSGKSLYNEVSIFKYIDHMDEVFHFLVRLNCDLYHLCKPSWNSRPDGYIRVEVTNNSTEHTRQPRSGKFTFSTFGLGSLKFYNLRFSFNCGTSLPRVPPFTRSTVKDAIAKINCIFVELSSLDFTAIIPFHFCTRT